MILSTLDWSIIIGFFIVFTTIGVVVSKQSGKNAKEFFLSGRNMPWWLLGISMVATTFSADTPNLVTDIVRQNGISGNWVWWSFLLTGMLTVFVYAKLWRRSEVLTDLEFYELRYSGKAAAFLRGFRAIYLGVFFNVMIMASVCLAAIKIGSVLFGLQPWECVLYASIVTVAYSAFGGLKGVIFTDFIQFIIAMVGAVWAMFYIINLPEVGGFENLLAHDNVSDKLDFLPNFTDTKSLIPLLIIPIAVQWWSVWYPGAEPGGGGYIAQRMLSAKDEKNAIGATLLFNIAHYALRPWPWILIGLASLVVYSNTIDVNSKTIEIAPKSITLLNSEITPQDIQHLITAIDFQLDATNKKHHTEELLTLKNTVQQHSDNIQIKSLAYIFKKKIEAKEGTSLKPIEDWENILPLRSLVSLQLANPEVKIEQLGHDLGYPSMIKKLPSGLLGLVVASLIAAFMSTISTHLNWGSSYIAIDFYKRFVRPEASEKSLVNIGRCSTVILMLFAALFALVLESALSTFNILLQIGAGTGLIFILRWFWWRINAYSEISGMIVSFLIALWFEFVHEMVFGTRLENHEELVLGVCITTITWITVTLLTKPTNDTTLASFYNKVKPYGIGWNGFKTKAKTLHITLSKSIDSFTIDLASMLLGVLLVYCSLFASGYFIYGNMTGALILSGIALCTIIILLKIRTKTK